jgi:hypothetical protein
MYCDAANRFYRDVMTEAFMKELQAEIQHLREVVVSLSITLLRQAALNLHETRPTATTTDAERLLLEAEECFRCAKLPGLRTEIAEGLQVAGHELMAKAVAIESNLQRIKSVK